MTDSEKLRFIETIMANAWEAVPSENEAMFWRGVLIALETVIASKGETT